MYDTIKDILDSCPTHGFCTIDGHSVMCPNEDHRKLAEALLANDVDRTSLEDEISDLEDEIRSLKDELDEHF